MSTNKRTIRIITRIYYNSKPPLTDETAVTVLIPIYNKINLQDVLTFIYYEDSNLT